MTGIHMYQRQSNMTPTLQVRTFWKISLFNVLTNHDFSIVTFEAHDHEIFSHNQMHVNCFDSHSVYHYLHLNNQRRYEGV